MPKLIIVRTSDGETLAGYNTSDLEDCNNCGGKTFPGHQCD